eukprot:2019750-Amphidinium_carterae.1
MNYMEEDLSVQTSGVASLSCTSQRIACNSTVQYLREGDHNTLWVRVLLALAQFITIFQFFLTVVGQL